MLKCRFAVLVFVATFGCQDDTAQQPSKMDLSMPDMVRSDADPDTAGLDTPSEVSSPLDMPPDQTRDGEDLDVEMEDDLVSCGSLFAARILELQVALEPTFPHDCEAPLRSDVGDLKESGNPLCYAGESPNGCRERLYRAPPAMDELRSTCWDSAQPEPGCLRGKWLPKCSNGTDEGCDGAEEVVCQDGMRPMAYMEAASTPSNRWIFHMGGEGGPCSGGGCWFNYRYAGDVGQPPKAAFETAMTTIHPDHFLPNSQFGNGITYGRQGPPTSPFEPYNRVKWNRCSDAASDRVQDTPLWRSNPAVEDLEAFRENATVWGSAPVWHKGLPTWIGLFRSLATQAGRDIDGDNAPDLPSIADAETVLLAGSSDASLWLVYAADRLRDELRQIAGTDVDVRILIDGYYDPMLDNEGRYQASAATDFSLFTHPYQSSDPCRLPEGGDDEIGQTCSDTNYRESTHNDGSFTLRGNLERRGVVIDESCVTTEGEDSGRCYDRGHFMVHHVDTPLMFVADQEDNTISGARLAYADDDRYVWPDPATYRRRILDQTYDIRDHWTTGARKGGAGKAGDLAFLLRKSRRGNQPWARANHVHFSNNTKMAWKMTRCDAQGRAVETLSIAGAILAWVDGSLGHMVIAEDASQVSSGEDYWITGETCTAAE
jgi:hypothetical protein